MREPLQQEGLSKAPAVTLGFWLIKIFATTTSAKPGAIQSP